MSRLTAHAAACLAHAAFRLSPATSSTLLATVHAMLGTERVTLPTLVEHLAAHRELYRLTGIGWAWIGRTTPPNPVAENLAVVAPRKPRTRGELLDLFRDFGPSFRYADALRLGIQANQLTQLLNAGHISRIDRGRYRVFAKAPTARRSP